MPLKIKIIEHHDYQYDYQDETVLELEKKSMHCFNVLMCYVLIFGRKSHT